MLPYFFAWSLFAIPGLSSSRRINGFFYLLSLVFLTLFIGLRFEVGGDWHAYLKYAVAAIDSSWQEFSDIAASQEIGYRYLTWCAVTAGGNVFVINAVCAFLFALCLLQFSRAQPRPWLCLTIAFPYLVTVVSMGYTKQSVAIGFELLALLALQKQRLLPFLAWISIASLFHQSVLVLLILPVFTISSNSPSTQWLRFFLLVGSAYGIATTFLSERIQQLYSAYVLEQYSSSGAFIRVALLVFPSIIFLVNRNRFSLPASIQKIWVLISLASLVAAISLFLVPSSTAIDRLALYLIPIQLFVGSRIPDARVFGIPPQQWTFLLVIFSFAVLFVWLVFADNNGNWLPYQNLLLPRSGIVRYS